jgi:hypothetical protein
VLVRDFSPIVLVLAGSMGHRWKHVAVGCRTAAQLVGDELQRWHLLVFQYLATEACGSFPVPVACDQNIEDVIVLIHCSPKIMPFAADREE